MCCGMSCKLIQYQINQLWCQYQPDDTASPITTCVMIRYTKGCLSSVHAMQSLHKQFRYNWPSHNVDSNSYSVRTGIFSTLAQLNLPRVLISGNCKGNHSARNQTLPVCDWQEDQISTLTESLMSLLYIGGHTEDSMISSLRILLL